MLIQAVEALQPFYDATNELSGVKYSTVSVVIPIFQSLLILQNTQDENSDFTLIFKTEY